MFVNESGKLMSLVSQCDIHGFKKMNRGYATDVHIHEMDKNGTEFKLLCTPKKSLGDKFILKALKFHNITTSYYHKIFDRLDINIELSMGLKHTLLYKKFVIEHLNKLNTPTGRPYLVQMGNDVILTIPWQTMFHDELTDQISDNVKITLLVRTKKEIDNVSAIFKYTVMDLKSIEMEDMAKNWHIGVSDMYYFNALTNDNSKLSFDLDVRSPLQGLIMRFDDKYDSNLNSMEIWINGYQYSNVLVNDLHIRHLIMDDLTVTNDLNIIDYFFIPLSEMDSYTGCPNMYRIENSTVRLSFNDYAYRNVEIVAIAYNALGVNGFRFSTLGNRYIDSQNMIPNDAEELDETDYIMTIEI